MTAKIRVAHEILFALIIIFIIISLIFLENDTFNARDFGDISKIKDYQHHWEPDASLNCGGKDVVQFTIDDEIMLDTDLSFFASHQECQIFIDGEKIFSEMRKTGALYGKTPGKYWATIRINKEDFGKSIQLEFIPAYKNVIGKIPKLYLGESGKIIINRFRTCIFTMIISLSTLFVGIFFLLWIGLNFKKIKMDWSLFYLFGFAIYVGMWKIFDMDIMFLIFDNSIVVSYMPILLLMLVIVPFTLFLKELFRSSKNFPFYFLCIASIVYGIVAILLHVLNIYDIRETLIVCHLLIATLFVGGIHGNIVYVKHYGWNKSIKVKSMCLCACFVGAMFDMFFYYFIKNETSSCFGILGFLVYISVLGFAKIEESRKLMEVGKNAEKYQNMAFIDSLTTMFSRMAFNHVTSSKDFQPLGTCVIMCDLNNLKKCNDTYGHEAGDRYLTESAKLIQKVFDKYGVCFRMGGDEFTIILKRVTIKQCEEYIKELECRQQEYVKTHPEEFPIHIACGCAIFDPEMDHDFSETMRRADKIMYENKFKSKM